MRQQPNCSRPPRKVRDEQGLWRICECGWQSQPGTQKSTEAEWQEHVAAQRRAFRKAITGPESGPSKRAVDQGDPVPLHKMAAAHSGDDR